MVDEIFDRAYQAARATSTTAFGQLFSGLGRAVGQTLRGPSPDRMERALGSSPRNPLAVCNGKARSAD